MKNFFVLLIYCVIGFSWQKSIAQQTLSLEQFLGIVKQYHPVAQQAQIQISIAKTESQATRGAFDPAFYINQNQKEFGGKNYYQYFNTELKVPTWYGIDLKAGTENNQGYYTDNELSTGKNSFVGIQASLGKGLLMDKRRAAVLQAKQMISFSEEEKKLMLNELLYDASAAFFDWQNAFQQKQLIDSALAINQQRYQFIKTSFLLGDRPAIDTTEALTQLQNFEFLQAETQQQLTNSTIALSNFLWKDQQEPYQLPNTVFPAELSGLQTIFSFNDYLTDLNEHPKLQQASVKMKVLEIDKQLKFQSILPTANVQYNILNKGYTFVQQPSFFQNNYKWGFTLGMPLLLREGRADFRKAKLKITQQTWQNSLLQNELQNKLRQYYNDAIQLQKQAGIYRQNVLNYQKLYDGELSKFKNGESSMFLLNSRENKLLEAQQKLALLRTKASKSIVAIGYATGKLGQ